MTFPCRQISASISAPSDKVYQFVADPANLPQWAAGLSGSIQKIGADWVADSPLGRVTVRFAEKNPFGVLDHVVTLPNGEAVLNPLRVLPNGDGSEIVFTLYQRQGQSDKNFVEDAAAVERDLQKLKTILERG